MSDTAGGDAPQPLKGVVLAVTAVALALGTFMQVLDTTIANVSLPTIAGNLGVSSDTSTWVITSFAVANGVALPLTGWLMGRFGVVRVFVLSVFLFTIASLLCGLAWDLPSLIAFRVLQGATSGPLIPGSQALLIATFPPDKRGTALGVWAITVLTAPVAGPLLGGWISDNYHWSWIFLINVPVGIFCGLVTWTSLRTHETPTRKLPVDRVGLALLVIWVGALQIMLDLGKNDDWFNSTRIVVFACIALIGFCAWIIWELTEEHPAVDLTLFKNRNFMIGTISLCLSYAVFFASLVVQPLWLQTQLGYTATWAGLVAAPSGAVAVVLSPVVARFGAKVDARILATASLAAFAGSYFMRAGYTTDASFVALTVPLLLQGVGMSMFFVAMLNIQLDGVEERKIPSASGISNFIRIISASFAASIVTTSWDRREALHQSRLAEIVNGGSPAYAHAVDTMHRLGIGDTQAAALISRQITQQAYLLSLTDLFWLCGWITIALIASLWFARRPRGGQGHVAAD